MSAKTEKFYQNIPQILKNILTEIFEKDKMVNSQIKEKQKKFNKKNQKSKTKYVQQFSPHSVTWNNFLRNYPLYKVFGV